MIRRFLPRFARDLSISLKRQAYAPGHFYSPVIDSEAFEANRALFVDPKGELWKHIDLNPAGQLAHLQQLVSQPALPFPETSQPGKRYYSRNDHYGYGSAVFLAYFLASRKPRRVVEVGSGFSSAVMLDVADSLGLKTQFTFIDPYPERLERLLTPADHQRVEVIAKPVQEVQPGCFEALESGDILFIDSSHVVKPGSDLVHLLLSIIPRLKPGVLIHFHDIVYPGTYPESWLERGFSWNETYFIRAFLLFNSSFRIVLLNEYLRHHHRETLAKWNAGVAGSQMSSIWIERTR